MNKNTKEKILYLLIGALITLIITIITFFLPKIFKDKKITDLQLVNVYCIDTNSYNILSSIEIWLKNDGNKSAQLTSINFYIERIIEIPPIGIIEKPKKTVMYHVYGLKGISHTYELGAISPQDEGEVMSIILSQEIPPYESDKFRVQLSNNLFCDRGYIIVLSMEIIYNSDKLILELPKLAIGITPYVVRKGNLDLYFDLNNYLVDMEYIDSNGVYNMPYPEYKIIYDHIHNQIETINAYNDPSFIKNNKFKIITKQIKNNFRLCNELVSY